MRYLTNAMPLGPLPAGMPDPELFRVDHSAIARKHLDVAYGATSAAQKLDLYLPDSPGNYPLILFIHGGAFMMCDKADGQVQSWLQATTHGYAVASLNYRLSGEAIFPAGIQDVKLALRYLRAHAAEYGIDGSRVAAVGGSSGGNYAAMMCVLSGRDELADRRDYADQSEDVQAGVIWFPPTDFPLMDAQLRESGAGVPDHSQQDSPESLYLGGPLLELDPEYVQQANPVTYVHKGMPPTFIQHGRKDRLVPWQQSELLVDRIEEVCETGQVSYEILENADHGDPLFDADENIAKCLAWLDESMK